MWRRLWLVLGGIQLQSRLGHCLYFLRFLVVFLSPSTETLGHNLKLDYFRFLPNPSKFTVIQTFDIILVTKSFVTYATAKKMLAFPDLLVGSQTTSTISRHAFCPPQLEVNPDRPMTESVFGDTLAFLYCLHTVTVRSTNQRGWNSWSQLTHTIPIMADSHDNSPCVAENNSVACDVIRWIYFSVIPGQTEHKNHTVLWMVVVSARKKGMAELLTNFSNTSHQV
jgi:hypothetical protein